MKTKKIGNKIIRDFIHDFGLDKFKVFADCGMCVILEVEDYYLEIWDLFDDVRCFSNEVKLGTWRRGYFENETRWVKVD